MEDFASKYDTEFSLVTLVSSVDNGGFGGDIKWIVDSGASSHMMRIWRVFLDFIEIGPSRQVVNEGGMARVVCGVGNVRFQLEFGGEISLIRLIKIFATVLLFQRTDLIHWGFLDAF
jgi:hypothetical protein